MEDHRMGVALLDGGAQRRSPAKAVALTDELIQRDRSHAHRQRTSKSWPTLPFRAPGGAGILLEQRVHSTEYSATWRRAALWAQEPDASVRGQAGKEVVNASHVFWEVAPQYVSNFYPYASIASAQIAGAWAR